jgi:hypothetical protein
MFSLKAFRRNACRAIMVCVLATYSVQGAEVQGADMTMHDVPWQDVVDIAKQFVDLESPPGVWPFAKEDLHNLSLSSKKVFIHYFPPLPISIDNKSAESDYWAKEFLQRSGEGNKYANVGGYVRQRPLPAGPWNSPYWQEIEAAIDVLRAHALGADGFGVDILQIGSGRFWDQARRICAAASALQTDFYFIPEIDAAVLSDSSIDEIVQASEELATCPAAYRLSDGRILFVPFAPNTQSPAFWKEVQDRLAQRNIAIAFVPDLLGLARNADQFARISTGLTYWGARDPDTLVSKPQTDMERHAASLTRYWMQPVAPQDARPKASLLWEADNTGLLRASWMKAIEHQADFVHMITWNDYGEATEFAPSSGSQFLFYDLSAFYIQWYKTGRIPRIVKDAIYYSHRTQIFDPTRLFAPNDRPFRLLGSTPLHNDVEMVAMLTQPATLQIDLAGKTTEKTVAAGLQTLKAPASPGRPIFRIIRNGRTVAEKESDWSIDANPNNSNPDYFGGSSTRVFAAVPSLRR